MESFDYHVTFELLSLAVTCVLGFVGLKGRGRWQVAYCALLAFLSGAALLTRSRWIEFAIAVSLGFGIGISIAVRHKDSIAVLPRRQPRLIDELRNSRHIWAAWHTGMITGADGEVLKQGKIKRLVVSAPDAQALAEVEKITGFSRAAFSAGVQELTDTVKKRGGNVRWFDGPIQNSTIISDPDDPKAWARVEFLMPFTPPALRPSIKVFKRNDPELFSVIRDSFEELWHEKRYSTEK
jgi:hypothetical protein